jgi:hypothetical protein
LLSSEHGTFNTLKNQGYNSEPNYGQVKQNLATILALLMFLAFTVDQMMQRCWRLFRQVRGGLQTKAKLWESVHRRRISDQRFSITTHHHKDTLFAANPFGAKEFTKGATPLNYSLEPGQKATFCFRALINSGKLTKEQTEALDQQFLKDVKD